MSPARAPAVPSVSIASTPLELVHSDVLSINVPSLGGRRYVVTFVDDHTRMLWVEPLARKSDVFEAFVRFKAKVENESGRRIQRFRSDNGGEYMSRTFDDMLAEHGIIRESPPPYSPQSNGVAERVNRSIVEGIVSLLAQAGAPKALWAEALQAFVFVKNRSPHAALSGNVPLAVWRNRPARVDMLRTSGHRRLPTSRHATPRPLVHGLEHVTPFTPAPPRPDFARASAPTPSTPDSPDPLDFLSDPFGLLATARGVDFRDTFAPVAKFTSIRVLLALAARQKMLIHQADVDKAYLHGSLDEELYMCWGGVERP
ncbi:hypothetical protein Rt10032_c34g6894 [Rhodotorula toruloides]|uniref:Integrase catalytic domain-containing protein n=1 Tax=Rhodotorula toruloides TaxID=5286 RepID=A0A511KR74_RHOTO|nr:hypothetical protein Rt10032_c34g6894 [Rhodotorula toruloides]